MITADFSTAPIIASEGPGSFRNEAEAPHVESSESSLGWDAWIDLGGEG